MLHHARCGYGRSCRRSQFCTARLRLSQNVKILTFPAGTTGRMADGSQWNKQDDATMMSAILNIIGLSQQEGTWRMPFALFALRGAPRRKRCHSLSLRALWTDLEWTDCNVGTGCASGAGPSKKGEKGQKAGKVSAGEGSSRAQAGEPPARAFCFSPQH